MPVDNNKMASILFTIGGAVMNALAFSGTKILWSKLMDHGEKERKRHDLALEKLQRARTEWNKDRMNMVCIGVSTPSKALPPLSFQVSRLKSANCPSPPF